MKNENDLPENPMADTNGRFLTRLNPCPGTGTFSTSGSNPIMIDTKKVERMIPPLKFDQTIHFLVVFPPKVKIPDQNFCLRKLENLQSFQNTISVFHRFSCKNAR